MRIHRLVTGLMLAVLCGPGVLADAAPAIRVAQVVAQDTAVTVYLDIRDGDGRAVAGVAAEQLSATLGARPASVEELVPVADTSEGIAHIFLVDVSKSLTAAQFALLKTALAEWADGLRPVDRAALIAFGKGVRVVQDFTGDVALLKTQIVTLAPTDSQTFFHQGLVSALTLGQRRDAGLPERRVIVTLTDGIDDVAGGVTADEVYTQLRESRIPLYAIGLASGRDRAKRDAGLNALGQFARRSGGSFRDASGADDLPAAYSTLRQEIAEQYRVRLSCADCIADGTLHRLQLVLRQDPAVVSTDLDVRLLAARDTLTGQETPAEEATPSGEDEAPPAPDAAAEPAKEEASTVPGKADTAEEAGKTEKSTTPTEGAWSVIPSFEPWQWSAATAALLLTVVLLWLILQRRRTAAAETAAAELRAGAEAARSVPDPAELPPTQVSPPRTPPPPAGPRLQLTAVSGQRRGERFGLVLDGPKAIGRAADCALVLDNDPEVSQRHCQLRFSGAHLMIEDLGSTNGTRVNGVPIAAAYALADGDIVGIGRTELRVTWPQTPQ
jgi:VWFA-related protein